MSSVLEKNFSFFQNFLFTLHYSMSVYAVHSLSMTLWICTCVYEYIHVHMYIMYMCMGVYSIYESNVHCMIVCTV